MTNDEMKELQPGDIVQSKPYGLGYVVTANDGNRVSAVRTADITNPTEWLLIRKSAQHSVQRIGCTCRQIDEDTIEVNVNCVVHGKNANR